MGSSTLATESYSPPGHFTGEASSYHMCRLLGLQSERKLCDTYPTASDISAIAQGVSVEQLMHLQRSRGVIDFQDNHTTLRGCVSHHSCYDDKPHTSYEYDVPFALTRPRGRPEHPFMSRERYSSFFMAS